MGRVEVEDALRRWREAAHQVDITSPGSPEWSTAEQVAARRKLLYQEAVLAGRGRADVLEVAPEKSNDQPGDPRALPDTARRTGQDEA